MSVSQMNQSPSDRALGRFDYTLSVRKNRALGLEYALAMQRYEDALNACAHWEAPEKPGERRGPEGTYQCCTRVVDAQAACTAAYEMLLTGWLK
jgi:hypothetical protein